MSEYVEHPLDLGEIDVVARRAIYHLAGTTHALIDACMSDPEVTELYLSAYQSDYRLRVPSGLEPSLDVTSNANGSYAVAALLPGNVRSFNANKLRYQFWLPKKSSLLGRLVIDDVARVVFPQQPGEKPRKPHRLLTGTTIVGDCAAVIDKLIIGLEGWAFSARPVDTES